MAAMNLPAVADRYREHSVATARNSKRPRLQPNRGRRPKGSSRNARAICDRIQANARSAIGPRAVAAIAELCLLSAIGWQCNMAPFSERLISQDRGILDSSHLGARKAILPFGTGSASWMSLKMPLGKNPRSRQSDLREYQEGCLVALAGSCLGWQIGIRSEDTESPNCWLDRTLNRLAAGAK